MKSVDTVTYYVWSIIRESYADMKVFSARTLKEKPLLAQLEDQRSEHTKTSRISASLCLLRKRGAIVCTETIKGENQYITDSETIMLWSPGVSCRKLGAQRKRRVKLPRTIPPQAFFPRFDRVL